MLRNSDHQNPHSYQSPFFTGTTAPRLRPDLTNMPGLAATVRGKHPNILPSGKL